MNPDRDRLASRLLLIVGFAYLAAQLVLFSTDRAPSWDEAIYLSQVTRGSPALPFVASRARGITLLAAPVAASASTIAVRVAFAGASSLALALAFRTWIRLAGLAAPLAAFLVAGSWLGLLYGSEVMPNLWAALLGVAAAGFAGRFATGTGDRHDEMRAGVLLGIMAVVRPPDALVLGLVLILCLALLRKASGAPAIAALAVGLFVGWLPWLVEMSVRFGGPVAAVREAGRIGHVGGGALSRVTQHLALADGPTLGPEPGAPVTPAGALWWGALIVLVMVGVARSRWAEAAALSLATVGGVAMAVQYLVVVSGLAPRFLLPAYALLALPAATGMLSLARGTERARLAVAVAAGLALALWTGWQIGTANRIESEQVAARGVLRDVGRAIDRDAGGGPCAVLSTEGYPQVAFAARCMGSHLMAGEDGGAAVSRLTEGGWNVYVVRRSTPNPVAIPGAPRSVPAPPGWEILAATTTA